MQIGSRPEAPAEIVGIVRDVKYETLREPPHKVVYEAYTQSLGAAGAVYLELRSTSDLTALAAEARRALRELAAQIPVETFTMTEWLDQFLIQERLLALLSSAFGSVALMLAAVGLYGVTSYTAARRTAEFGLRMALGAPSGAVRWLMIRETLWVTSAGISIGLLATLVAGRFVSSLLFGLTTHDGATLGYVGALLMVGGLIAGYLPARRASRVSPTIALRAE